MGETHRVVSPARVFARPTADEIWLGAAQRAALSQLSHPAQIRVIVGPRSSGKTTLLHYLGAHLHSGAAVLHSPRETTQPNLAALEYWASGLTPVYLAGALERALTAPVAEPTAEAEAAITDDAAEPRPVLNPFSVYGRGETMLRRQLAALSPRHLRAIATGYDLADPADIDLEALTAPELIDLITTAVRARLAA